MGNCYCGVMIGEFSGISWNDDVDISHNVIDDAKRIVCKWIMRTLRPHLTQDIGGIARVINDVIFGEHIDEISLIWAYDRIKPSVILYVYSLLDSSNGNVMTNVITRMDVKHFLEAIFSYNHIEQGDFHVNGVFEIMKLQSMS
jgi:hypothetical protein